MEQNNKSTYSDCSRLSDSTATRCISPAHWLWGKSFLMLTLFRLGFFGQSVTGGGGGGGGLLGPPLCISGTNNARVMKFTHNDHLHTKKPRTQI